jgi:hypothetical protein
VAPTAVTHTEEAGHDGHSFLPASAVFEASPDPESPDAKMTEMPMAASLAKLLSTVCLQCVDVIYRMNR